MSHRLRIATVVSLLLQASLLAQAPSVFQFEGNLNAQAASPGNLSYFNNDATPFTFGTPASFGIPALPGGSSQVVGFPTLSSVQGLLLQPGVGPNGGGAYINNYTMGFDILLPDRIWWFSFFQTNETNVNDGDLFARPAGLGDGVGISGSYAGIIDANRWYRLMVTVDQGNNTMSKYLDGVLLETQAISGGLDGRWSLYSSNDPGLGVLLLTDNDGDASAGYLNSLYFSDSILSASEIAALGGVTASGFAAVPEPATYVLIGISTLVIGPIYYRRKQSKAKRK